MPLNNQILAYEDCFELFQRALADSRGIRARFYTSGKARHMQMRMNQARALEREESRRMYPSDDLRWNKSQFDVLAVKVNSVGNEWWVVIERHGCNVLEIESLSTKELKVAK